MKFRDLAAQYNVLKSDIDNGIATVLNEEQFILGSQVETLEKSLAKFVGVKHCVSCANGTDALILPLMAWGVGVGDAVFVPNFTYFATANCALVRNATPVLVDIDARTFNMLPESLEEAIEKTIKNGKIKPKVIIPVDLFGLPADYIKIEKIAEKYGLKILEDGAQGFGGSINGKVACSYGDAATTSFFPAKPLGCYGDGGAIFTNDDELAETLRSMRSQGRSKEDKYDNRTFGLNSRLDTLQAAILIPKLKALEEVELRESNKVAAAYTDRLKNILVTPLIPEDFYSSWAQYTILLENEEQRDSLQKYLKESDVPSMIYYPRTMSMQTALLDTALICVSLDNSERICKRCLSIPIHPYLNMEEIELITGLITKFYRGKK